MLLGKIHESFSSCSGKQIQITVSIDTNTNVKIANSSGTSIVKTLLRIFILFVFKFETQKYRSICYEKVKGSGHININKPHTYAREYTRSNVKKITTLLV